MLGVLLLIFVPSLSDKDCYSSLADDKLDSVWLSNLPWATHLESEERNADVGSACMGLLYPRADVLYPGQVLILGRKKHC